MKFKSGGQGFQVQKKNLINMACDNLEPAYQTFYNY